MRMPELMLIWSMPGPKVPRTILKKESLALSRTKGSPMNADTKGMVLISQGTLLTGKKRSTSTEKVDHTEPLIYRKFPASWMKAA